MGTPSFEASNNAGLSSSRKSCRNQTTTGDTSGLDGGGIRGAVDGGRGGGGLVVGTFREDCVVVVSR